MRKRRKKRMPLPRLREIKQEMQRLQAKNRWRRALRSIIYTLIVVAAVAVLIAMLFMPVMRVAGSSMEPNLNNGDIIVGIKSGSFETGQVCCFYYNNRLLLKRVIANSGDWVDMDEAGHVYVNGTKLNEPYVQERSLGICDIAFPYQVPDGTLFVMGDHRSTSVDSRSTTVGCIPVDEIVGKLVFRIWPINGIGMVE